VPAPPPVLQVAAFRLAALPAGAAGLLDAAEREDFQLGRAWFEAVAEAALPAGARVQFLLAQAGGAGRVLLPLLRRADGTLAGLTTPYTCVFRPLAAADATPAELHAAGRGFARFCRPAGPLRLDALDAEWPGLAPLLGGFRAGGMWPLGFDHFGNWHLPLGGRDWAAYLAGRPGALRETIRRKLPPAERNAGFALVADGAGLPAAIAAYESVQARSWKGEEPFPRLPAALIRAAAARGALRLAVLRQHGRPVAAQIWVVAGGIATLHKLVHDEGARKTSPGTVLTAWTIRRLLATEPIAALDFGRGDDAYKAGWTGQRRQRRGVLLCPPAHPAGLAALARHFAGRLRAGVAHRPPPG
jgi:CelD/BcsL family acetyltransferase involved in cellulose biosynthesis